MFTSSFFFYLKLFYTFFRLLRDEYEKLENCNKVTSNKQKYIDIETSLKTELHKQATEFKLKLLDTEKQLEIAKQSNTAIKQQLQQKVETMKDLLNVEQKLQEYQCINIKLKNNNQQLTNNLHKITTEYEQLKKEFKTLNENINKMTDENSAVLKQMHEIQKMHVFKVNQLQTEIQTNKQQKEFVAKELEELRSKCRSEQSFTEKVLKINELHSKNQHLTLEIDELRGRLEKDRKSRRHSTHDEKRNLLFGKNGKDMHSIETQTSDPNGSCGCAEMDKQIKELQRDNKIKECQISGLITKISSNPLRAENEKLNKVSIFCLFIFILTRNRFGRQ